MKCIVKKLLKECTPCFVIAEYMKYGIIEIKKCVLGVLYMKAGLSKVKISFNSPVILSFAIICLLSLLLGMATEGKTTDMFFSV